MHIPSIRWRHSSIRQWCPAVSAIRRGTDILTHWHMCRNGIHASMDRAAPIISVFFHAVSEIFRPLGSNIIHFRHIVSIFRCFIQQLRLQYFITFKICPQCVQEFFRIDFPFFKHQLSDCLKAVRQIGHLNTREIVFRTAPCDIYAAAYAILYDTGEKCTRKIVLMSFFQHFFRFHHFFNVVIDYFAKPLFQFLIGLICIKTSKVFTQLFSSDFINTMIQCQFKCFA